ncbi:hypothetical protein [Bacillus gobiensis]|nr:hypothetical protein [Bacillus gobiensis]
MKEKEKKKKKEECLSRKDIEELMGVNRPTYKRYKGAIKQKRNGVK